LNKATQLESFIILAQESDSSWFATAYASVRQLQDRSLDQKMHLAKQKQIGEHLDRVTNFFERVGFLVNQKYLDRKLAVNWWGVSAKDAYDPIWDWIAEYQRSDPGFCSEFKGFVEASEYHWLRCGRTPQPRSGN
jgi:hypothetical protein